MSAATDTGDAVGKGVPLAVGETRTVLLGACVGSAVRGVVRPTPDCGPAQAPAQTTTSQLNPTASERSGRTRAGRRTSTSTSSSSSTGTSVYRKLSEQFEQCVVGLKWVKLYINDPFYQYMFREFDIT